MSIEDKIRQVERLLTEIKQEQQAPTKRGRWNWVDVTEQCTPVLCPSDKDEGMFYIKMYYGEEHVASQRSDGGWYGLRDLNPLFRVEPGSKPSSLKIKHWELVE